MKFVKRGVFYAMFFNSAFIILFATFVFPNADGLLKRLFTGIYCNINSYWFLDVGDQIVSSMILNMCVPIITFSIKWTLNFISKIRDSCSKTNENGKKTKAKTLMGYIDLNIGPDFKIHYKNSYIMNGIFVTMLYGPALPILFPICLAKLCFMYIMERIMVAYFYCKPPMYDE